MKSLLYSLAFILLLAAGALAFTKQRDPMAKCKQLIVVTTDDWNSSQAMLRRYSRGNIRMPWKPVGEPIAVMIGKNGLAWGMGDGSTLMYSTYLGGTTADWGVGIAVDGSGAAYVVGSTVSHDFPTTVGAFQPG